LPSAYDLAEIKRLVREREYVITSTALRSAFELGFDDAGIYRCITQALESTHFYKSMPSEKNPGLRQDVYILTYEGVRLYVKLQISNDKCVVISFKEEGSLF